MFREPVEIKYNTLTNCYIDSNGVPPSVSYNYRKVEVDRYSELFDGQRNDSEIIYLMLDYQKGSSRKLRDYVYWSLGNTNPNTIICSPKFKAVLETLNLPKYTFYPAEIDVGKKVYQYYVLHYINNFLEDIDYANSQFATTPYIIEYKPITHVFNKDEITDYETYKKLEIESLTNKMEWIFPLKIKFLPDKHFDIWNFNGHHIISESAMDKILAANITGVAMPSLADTELDFLEIS